MSIRVLGPVGIVDRDGRELPIAGRKARALLALLAVRLGRLVPVATLEDELWYGTPPPGARTTLHAHVSRLRATLREAGAPVELVTGAGGYRLAAAPEVLDSARFETLARAGTEAAATAPQAAVSQLTHSLEEWRGPALQDLDDYEPLFLEAQRLEELRLVTIERRWDCELQLGGHLLAVGQLQRLVVDHPLRERLQGLLMLALQRSGRQTEALRAYRVAVSALAEVGIAPGPELRDLERRIATQDPALDLRASTTSSTPSEREAVLAAWAEAMATGPAVLVVDHDARSTPLDLLRTCAEAAGAIVLHGQHAGASRPFALVADALRPVLVRRPDRYSALADALAPVVADEPPCGTDLDSPDRRLRAFDAVATVLAGANSGGPVLLILERVEEAGESTLDLVDHLIDHAAQRLVVLLTTSSREPTDPVRVRLANAERRGEVRRLTTSTPPGTDHRAVPDERHADSHGARAIAALDAAVEHSARAGDEALARLGYAEALRHYRRALAVLELGETDQPRRRTELLLACGRACHVAYELTEALITFRLAARSAAAIGDIALLNEAASGLAMATEFGMADAETVELLARALRSVPADSARRVELLAGLARTMPAHDHRRDAHAAIAVALARRLGDPRALAIALATSVLVTWEPGDIAARLATIDEVVDVADHLGWVDLVVEARNWRAATLLQLGRRREAEAETATLRDWARHSGRPFFVALAAMRDVATLLDARRLDEAEEALSHPPPGAHASPNFSEASAAQLFLLRLAQGRVAEIIPMTEGFDTGQAPFAWRAARVVALVHTGDDRGLDALRRQVAALPNMPRDWLWLSAVALLADACIAAGDLQSAPVLYRQLRGHRGETVVAAHGVASLGPVTPRLEALQALHRAPLPARASSPR